MNNKNYPDEKEVDIIIEDKGDPSVGIFGKSYEIKSVTIADEDRDEIRKDTQDFFENWFVDGKTYVYFSDELEQMDKEFYRE